MKAVLISIQPKHCDNICSYKKETEVRKKMPTLETPFKCYIYETQGRTETPFIDEEGHHIFKGRGQVIGEFICDRIETFTFGYHVGYRITPDELQQTCLTQDELMDYGRGDTLYGWHISNLVIYEKPKELSEFRRYVKDRCTFNEDGVCLGRNQNHVIMCDHLDCCQKEIKRPFQSWGYVEQLKGETE